MADGLYQGVPVNRRAARWLPYCVFPVLMLAALLSVRMLMAQGFAASTAALISVLLFGFIGVSVLERVMPYRRPWLQSHQDVSADVAHLLINAGIPSLWTPVQVFLLTAASVFLAERFGQGLWPEPWHWSAELALMLLIAEFGRYWVHLAAHRIGWLWRLHAVHHSPKRLYWLNANRFHPLEKLIFQIPEVAPFILLGTPAEIIAMYFCFNAIHGLLQHSNIALKGGILNWVFSLTELHRWHHSRLVHESDHNFGNNLIVWDLLFGTYYNPAGREVETIGLLNPDYPQTYRGMLKAPFVAVDISKLADYRKHDK